MFPPWTSVLSQIPVGISMKWTSQPLLLWWWWCFTYLRLICIPVTHITSQPRILPLLQSITVRMLARVSWLTFNACEKFPDFQYFTLIAVFSCFCLCMCYSFEVSSGPFFSFRMLSMIIFICVIFLECITFWCFINICLYWVIY